MLQKLVAIVGPTASGKSDLAVQLALQFNGEIVSADSRQVYKGLDIGSAKISRKEMMGISHYCLDIASPKRQFSVDQYQKHAVRAIQRICAAGKLPILVGGTAQYVYAVVDGYKIPNVKPNAILRKTLAKHSVEHLYSRLKKLDPSRAASVDKKNSRRLIRALEIIMTTGKPVPKLEKEKQFDVVIIGITRSLDELKMNIRTRLEQRMKQDLMREIQTLRVSGLSWQRLESFGLEYRYGAQYIQKKISKEEMIRLIERDSWRLVRTQLSWFTKDKRIHWIKNSRDAVALIRKLEMQKK